MKDNNINKLFSKYTKALDSLKEKFNKLYKEYQTLGEENPIEHIKYRIKTEESIKNKLQKNNLEFSSTNIENNLKDVVGVRIVCSFLSDLVKLIEYVKNDPELEILNIKDYVENPKESGYSSYHIIVAVPISIDGKLEKVKAEIQLRTMAMDMWASLDHKIRYKKNTNLPKETEHKLQQTREFINMIDIDLDELNKRRTQITRSITNKIVPDFCTKEELELFINKYNLALEIVEEKLTLIKEEYIYNNQTNPIEHIKGRIKPLEKMISKLEEKGQALSLTNLENYITDIGAIKVVCSFLSDAKDFINIINNHPSFIVLDRQDYIENPKESGYASYHFVVAVPININNKIDSVKIEIQVRTINMELWANLEHKLCYQKESTPETKKELKRIASALQIIDPEMDEIERNLGEENTSLEQPKKRILIPMKK